MEKKPDHDLLVCPACGALNREVAAKRAIVAYLHAV